MLKDMAPINPLIGARGRSRDGYEVCLILRPVEKDFASILMRYPVMVQRFSSVR